MVSARVDVRTLDRAASSVWFQLIRRCQTMATILESSGRTCRSPGARRAARERPSATRDVPQGAPVDRPIPVPNPVPIPNRERASQASAAVVDHLTLDRAVDRGGSSHHLRSGFGHQQGVSRCRSSVVMALASCSQSGRGPTHESPRSCRDDPRIAFWPVVLHRPAKSGPSLDQQHLPHHQYLPATRVRFYPT